MFTHTGQGVGRWAGDWPMKTAGSHPIVTLFSISSLNCPKITSLCMARIELCVAIYFWLRLGCRGTTTTATIVSWIILFIFNRKTPAEKLTGRSTKQHRRLPDLNTLFSFFRCSLCTSFYLHLLLGDAADFSSLFGGLTVCVRVSVCVCAVCSFHKLLLIYICL